LSLSVRRSPRRLAAHSRFWRAAAVLAEPAAVQVEVGDAGGGGGQERPVVADQHHRSFLAGQEPLQAGQPVEVEVVGGLVQQQHVEAGEQDGGQAGLDPLPARQPGQGNLENVGLQADLGQHARGAGVVVVAAEGEEAGQGVVVDLQLALPGMVADGPQGIVHGRLGHGQAGAAAQVVGGDLAGQRVRLLGQVADVEIRRRALDRAGGRLLEPGQGPQQGRLAGAVAAEHADAAGPVDDQVDRVEHDLGAVDHGEVPCGEHDPSLARPGPGPQPNTGPVGQVVRRTRARARRARLASRRGSGSGSTGAWRR
jgi:hypothetical protein